MRGIILVASLLATSFALHAQEKNIVRRGVENAYGCAKMHTRNVAGSVLNTLHDHPFCTALSASSLYFARDYLKEHKLIALLGGTIMGSAILASLTYYLLDSYDMLPEDFMDVPFLSISLNTNGNGVEVSE